MTRAPELSRLERASRRLVSAGSRIPLAQNIVLSPGVARPGYWVATVAGLLWGGLLSRGRIRRRGGLFVARGCPRWAFGRGGTTIGAVYLTHDHDGALVLEHEAVHRCQWRRYGLAFIPLYFAAGLDARNNRFEIEAGLERGGYV